MKALDALNPAIRVARIGTVINETVTHHGNVYDAIMVYNLGANGDDRPETIPRRLNAAAGLQMKPLTRRKITRLHSNPRIRNPTNEPTKGY